MSELFTDLERAPSRRFGRDAPFTRRLVLAVLALLVLAALAGAAGQRGVHSAVASPSAALSVTMPKTVRGGILFQARVEVTAQQRLAKPQLVLSGGWLDGIQVSSIEPQASEESAEGSSVGLSYDALAAGSGMTVWMEFQVAPTTVGRHHLSLWLRDGDRTVASIHRTLTILP
jgi:hypothetical protein